MKSDTPPVAPRGPAAGSGLHYGPRQTTRVRVPHAVQLGVPRPQTSPHRSPQETFTSPFCGTPPSRPPVTAVLSGGTLPRGPFATSGSIRGRHDGRGRGPPASCG